MTLAPPLLRHLRRLTDAGGVYEHALLAVPRPEHGYCVDDVARALVVVCRSTEPPQETVDLRADYLAFLLAAQSGDGRFLNRRSSDQTWQGEPSVEDCWGRGLWGLGVAVSTTHEPALRDLTLTAFERGAAWRSPWSRALAFAALGASDVLTVYPENACARALLADAAARISAPIESGWLWPEPRLTYANAVLPEVLLAAGAAFQVPALVDHGLALLEFLLERQTVDGHLSVVPVGGWGPEDRPPGFDQQPIEVAHLADACARAHDVTGDDRWLDALELAVSWFFGANDSATSLYDPDSGGGCDGLERDGRNENQGAESTLALISTLQQAQRLRQVT